MVSSAAHLQRNVHSAESLASLAGLPRYMWIQTMDPADQLNFAFDPLDPTKAGFMSPTLHKCYSTASDISAAASKSIRRCLTDAAPKIVKWACDALPHHATVQ